MQAFIELRGAIGPVCASKVLHILKPELFVPWDRDIGICYELDIYNVKSYLKFLEICKEELDVILKENRSSSDELRRIFYQDGWKPVTKLLDETHWAIAKGLQPHFHMISP